MKRIQIKFGQLESLAVAFSILQKMQFSALVAFSILQNIKEIQKGLQKIEEFRTFLLDNNGISKDDLQKEEVKNSEQFKKLENEYIQFLSSEFEIQINTISLESFGTQTISAELLEVIEEFIK